MARTRKFFREDDYLADYDNEPFSSPQAEADFRARGLETGYYQFATLEDMINNFVVSYIGDGKTLVKVPRHEVAFHMQRCVQEFSYDILRAENNIEVELNTANLQVALPQDFVRLVKITYTGFDGQEYTAHESPSTRSKQAILQDDQFEWNYDETGDILFAEESEGVRRWQDPANDFAQRDIARNYYYGSEYDEEYNYYSFYSFQGRRYGTDPQYDNQNGEYIIDRHRGLIYFSSDFATARTMTNDGMATQGFIVSIRYISDGISGNSDLNKVRVHKLAEGAVYADVLYSLAKVRPSAAAMVPLYKKEAMAMKRNAEIRLQ
ncbi:MAG: hypothetical protein MPJ22_11715, partial [Pirellulales bacterium]|nr:hypothetical protein [Pirellulales bacterium]